MFEFTQDEKRDLAIGFVALTICFAIATAGLHINAFISCLPIVCIGVAIGSILNELGHKFVAMKYHCQAEFKLWPLGLLIAFVTSFFGVVFASPVSVHIHPENISDEIKGKISIAGPMANIVLALIFIVLAALIFPFKFHSNIFNLIYLICVVGFSVNSFLATFNLFPLYSLDGPNVLKWNKGIWFISIFIAGIMMLCAITIGAENMVSLLMGA